MTKTNPLIKFSTVKRAKSKASIVIEGLSGKGKSGLALLIGIALAKGDQTKVFDIDTENGSIKLFDGLTSSAGYKFEGFQVADFTEDLGYKPSNYILFQKAAIAEGAEVVIQDSISHAWTHKGGILEDVNRLKQNVKRYQSDSYAAWGDPSVVEQKQALFSLFRNSKAHIISTVRVKEKMEYDRDESGKTKLVSLGEQQIMQGDTKYEPDLVLRMVEAGAPNRHPKAEVIKSRYAILTEGETYTFDPVLCSQLVKYLDEGTSPEELLKAQHEEYVKDITAFLDGNKNKVQVWNVLKEAEGYKEVSLDKIPLSDLKNLFIKLTM